MAATKTKEKNHEEIVQRGEKALENLLHWIQDDPAEGE